MVSIANDMCMVLDLCTTSPSHNKDTARELITSNVFLLTCHPMYHGMVIAAANSFFVSDLHQPIFWLNWAIFFSLLLTAGWFQEKETLARWGNEAEVYYFKTPRYIFEWPGYFIWKNG